MNSMKAKLKTVHSQKAAADYVKKGSMQLASQQDLFLYNKIDRVKKEEKSSSGDSTTHKSSSGTTHGGGRGSFKFRIRRSRRNDKWEKKENLEK